MEYKGKTATIIGLIANTFLFIIKLIAGLMSNSLAILSDAFNSLTDIVTAIAIFIAVKVNAKEPDNDHPFGHHRAEPIAGLIVAVFAGILGFEILKGSITEFFSPKTKTIMPFVFIVLIITIVMKFFMFLYFKKVGKQNNSPSISAIAIDCRNDVFISSTALLGVFGTKYGYGSFDSIAALFISFWIFKACYNIGTENINYLMGKSPEPKTIEEIKKRAMSIKGVKGLNSLRAHYVGNHIHVEVHIELDKMTPLIEVHSISNKVGKRIEQMDNMRAFVHADPV